MPPPMCSFGVPLSSWKYRLQPAGDSYPVTGANWGVCTYGNESSLTHKLIKLKTNSTFSISPPF